MNFQNIFILGLIISFIMIIPMNLYANEEAEKAAISTAKDWLKLVDDGKYDESWENASDFLKKAVTKEKLSESLKAAREPFGKVIKRSVKSSQYATSLPGAPDGEYVVIQFNTQFENKKEAIETITPMKEKDGSWKVSGYYIK